jgi:hypothetical protein
VSVGVDRCRRLGQHYPRGCGTGAYNSSCAGAQLFASPKLRSNFKGPRLHEAEGCGGQEFKRAQPLRHVGCIGQRHWCVRLRSDPGDKTVLCSKANRHTNGESTWG